MLPLIGALASLLVPAGAAFAGTTIAGGAIASGTVWTPAGSPYVVQGDITVPPGATLTIQAGTTVLFTATDSQASGADTARPELIVGGALVVDGTASSPVTFQAQAGSGSGVWHGIVVDSTATAARIQGAVIRNAQTGILTSAAGSAVRVTDAVIDSTDFGIYVTAGTPLFERVTVSGCFDGVDVYAWGSSSPTFIQLLAYGNSQSGLSLIGAGGTSTVNVLQSTIHGNGLNGIEAGASFGASLTVNVKNSILTRNGDGIDQWGQGITTVNVTYSDVWNNYTDYRGGSAPGPGTFSCNPLYVSAPTNLRLTSNSPARFASDAGTDIGALPYTSDPTPGVYGTLWSDTTIPAGTTSVPGDLVVAPGVTLTLSPGATLEFGYPDLMRCGSDTERTELSVHGAIAAGGTSDAPVRLTSPGTRPMSWYGLVFEKDAANGALSHAVIEEAVHAVTYRAASSSNAVTGVDVTRSDAGIVFESGAGVFEAISISGGTDGIVFDGTGQADFVDAVVRNNSGDGLRVHGASGSSTVRLVNSTVTPTGAAACP
jgi:hypothetical protein